MKRLTKILKNENGQGMLEYVLLLAIVIGLVMVFKKNIGDIFSQATDSIKSKSSNVFNDSN